MSAPPPPAPTLRCGKCAGELVADDLFCPNCGHEAPVRDAGGQDAAPAARRDTLEVHRFDCEGCGACLTWDVEVGGLRCAFCGEARLRPRPRTVRITTPDRVVPFEVTQADASRAFRTWLGEGWFRPSDLSRESEVTEMRGVYLPFWSFSGRCHTYWAADANVRRGRAAWSPYFGEREASYRGVLVPASGALTLAEVRAIDPWDLGRGVPYAPDVLDGRPAEAFGVTRRRARSLGADALEAAEEVAAAGEVPGTRSRNLKVNVLVTDLRAVPVLLPVWIVAYRYRDQTHRYLVNGQTGAAKGTAPWSGWKVLALLLGLTLAAAAIVFGILLAQRHL